MEQKYLNDFEMKTLPKFAISIFENFKLPDESKRKFIKKFLLKYLNDKNLKNKKEDI